MCFSLPWPAGLVNFVALFQQMEHASQPIVHIAKANATAGTPARTIASISAEVSTIDTRVYRRFYALFAVPARVRGHAGELTVSDCRLISMS
jgi:hypothetical protein